METLVQLLKATVERYTDKEALAIRRGEGHNGINARPR